MSIAVCTLFEGNYHIGAAALANSLYASGYRGTLWAGYRGALPDWAKGTETSEIADGFRVAFVRLETTEHLTNYKPAFIARMLTELAPDAAAVIYLDPDIVVKCRWESVFPHWLNGGLALVEDVNADMPARHPQRLAWSHWFEAHAGSNGSSPVTTPTHSHALTLAKPRALDRYYNAGFIGVPREHLAFLTLWRSIIMRSREVDGTDANKLKNGDATSLFHSADQDALNIALMFSPDTAINAAGPDAMDFAPGGHHLSHATGTPKPWQGGHFARALRGYPPSLATKTFLQHTAYPVAILTPAQRRRRRVALNMAAFIGRFYRRA